MQGQSPHQRPALGQALGFGWLGTIYMASPARDGTPQAVRSLAAERLGDVGRLAQLMAFAAQHPHPHVLPVSELRNDAQGVYGVYYVMPQARGGSLRGVFERYRAAGATVEVDTMLDVARQIGEGLDAAHARSVLHGNLKPENVLLQPLPAPQTDEYRLLLSDFGLNNLRPPEALSPYLPAPQRAGAAATLESDLYAVGAILFEGLTGRALPPQPLLADLIDIPDPAAKVIARCLGLSAPFADTAAFLGYLRAVQFAAQAGLGRVQITADHSYVDAIPGETQEVRLKVTSAAAQKLQLRLEGLPTEWTPALPTLDLQPGVEALVTFAFHLPRRPTVRANSYDTHIVALSKVGPHTGPDVGSAAGRSGEHLELARVPLAVRVQTFEHSVLRLTALPSVAHRTTTITANLSNQGNSPQQYNLEVNLPAGSTVLRGSARRQLELAPGAEFSEIVDVRLPTPGLSARTLMVTALANSASMPSDQTTREEVTSWLPTYNTVKDHLALEQRPLIPWWGLTLAALGLLGLGAWAARPPTIQTFELQGTPPMQGAPFTLGWRTQGARQVQITELPGQALETNGQLRLNGLRGPTTYTLVASGLFTQRQQQVTVTPTLPSPSITSFKVTPTQVLLGQSVRVEWSVSNATNVQLSPFGTVPASGSRELTPTRDTTLKLSARKTNQPTAEDASSTLHVTLRAPQIQTFTVTPSSAVRGQSVTLRWKVTGAKVVRLHPLGELPGSGSRTVTATQDTNYTLKASNGQQESTASASLSVRVPQARIEALTITPPNPQAGQLVRVQWRSQNATRAQLRYGEREQVVAPSGDVTLTATPDMQAITLVAENPNGEPAMLTRRLQVRPAAPVAPAPSAPSTAAQGTADQSSTPAPVGGNTSGQGPSASKPVSSAGTSSGDSSSGNPQTPSRESSSSASSSRAPARTPPTNPPNASNPNMTTPNNSNSSASTSSNSSASASAPAATIPSRIPIQPSVPSPTTTESPVRVQSFTAQQNGSTPRLLWQVSGVRSVTLRDPMGRDLKGPNADGSFPPTGTLTLSSSPQARTYVLSAGTLRASVQVPPTPGTTTKTTITASRYPGVTGHWNHTFGQMTLRETGGRVTGSLLSSRPDLPSGNLSGRLTGNAGNPTLNAYIQEGPQRVALIIRFDLTSDTFTGLYASRSARVPWCGWQDGAANPCP